MGKLKNEKILEADETTIKAETLGEVHEESSMPFITKEDIPIPVNKYSEQVRVKFVKDCPNQKIIKSYISGKKGEVKVINREQYNILYKAGIVV